MKAPFGYIGNKSRVAPIVWDALGNVSNYVEPFAGSLAVLLSRPDAHNWRDKGQELVNDTDQFLANFWRALALDPVSVARWADWPVNESDLLARHLWLVNTGRDRLATLAADADFFDAKVAGWWVWGLSAWIGSGWTGVGPHTVETVGKRPTLGGGQGVNRKRPTLGGGRGVNRKLPTLGGATSHDDDGDDEITTVSTSGTLARISVMRELAERLRRVTVCCGDWSRVVTDSALLYGAVKGVFLDPPYLGEVRQKNLYATDDHYVAADVRDWAIRKGDDPAMRIVLCGFESEHIEHMPESWRMISHIGQDQRDSFPGSSGKSANRTLERLWLSPHCLGSHQTQLDFGVTR